LNVSLVLRLDELDLPIQARDQPLGKGDLAVFFAFAVANKYLSAVKTDILDSQAATFHESHPAAVHQSGEQSHGTFGHFSQNAAHFIEAQHDGQSFGLFCALGIEADVLV